MKNVSLFTTFDGARQQLGKFHRSNENRIFVPLRSHTQTIQLAHKLALSQPNNGHLPAWVLFKSQPETEMFLMVARQTRMPAVQSQAQFPVNEKKSWVGRQAEENRTATQC